MLEEGRDGVGKLNTNIVGPAHFIAVQGMDSDVVTTNYSYVVPAITVNSDVLASADPGMLAAADGEMVAILNSMLVAADDNAVVTVVEPCDATVTSGRRAAVYLDAPLALEVAAAVDTPEEVTINTDAMVAEDSDLVVAINSDEDITIDADEMTAVVSLSAAVRSEVISAIDSDTIKTNDSDKITATTVDSGLLVAADSGEDTTIDADVMVSVDSMSVVSPDTISLIDLDAGAPNNLDVETTIAINPEVAASADLGLMVEAAWSVVATVDSVAEAADNNDMVTVAEQGEDVTINLYKRLAATPLALDVAATAGSSAEGVIDTVEIMNVDSDSIVAAGSDDASIDTDAMVTVHPMSKSVSSIPTLDLEVFTTNNSDVVAVDTDAVASADLDRMADAYLNVEITADSVTFAANDNEEVTLAEPDLK